MAVNLVENLPVSQFWSQGTGDGALGHRGPDRTGFSSNGVWMPGVLGTGGLFWRTTRRCGCSTAATSPSRAGSRREWPGSTAAGWARRPTAKPGCSWPASAHWVAPWCGELVEPGCTCRRSGPRTMPAARRRECRRTGGAAGRRLSWPWRCWRGPGSGVISGPSGLPETTPSGCRRPSVRDWRPWGCGTAGRSGRRHGLALGAGLDQSGIAEVRTPPQAQAGGRTAPDHGAAQR